ncbi:MAG TPA: SAVED domain-containing protein [Bellilinea sp.]|nr:SAVED domain-containing protein [Bellilinea sp.]
MAHFLFPKPRDWETFEDIVCDIYSRKYQSDNFQRYARRGQRQHGVDVVGRTQNGLLGIQCKHRTTGEVSSGEVDDEIARAEGFSPALSKLIIATSAATDGELQSHVLAVSEERIAQNPFPVEIVFWEKLVDQLTDYADLLYKHFTKHFPPDDFERLVFPGLGGAFKETIEWPVSGADLKQHIDQTLGGIVRVEPYSLSIGVSSFPDVSFQGLADVQVPLHQLIVSENESPTQFTEARRTLTELRSVIQPPDFSKELTIHMQTRLSLALLVGWVFRGVTGFNLRIIGRNGVWATSGLPAKTTGIFDDLPMFLNSQSSEVAVVLNFSQRNITSSVRDFVSRWSSPPQAVLGFSLPQGQIVNAAHALAVSQEIARKIKNLCDRWGTTHIHIFGAMPAALACLIGYQLNAICPLSLYYLDETRTEYRLAGMLTNKM